jgi:NhaP-type Na+/H+ or K+/H+ antiporter
VHFETGLLVLLFVILALIIGACVRHWLKGSQIPYTVALLILGIGIGLVHRSDLFQQAALGLTVGQTLGQTLDLVADISPHIILFVFLPTLIFESAFAMEVHLFRRMFSQIAILAVPGLILATGLTASLAKWAFPWDWSWALCLMFGALISATDPVAVVALLKEVSSRKRLETLIEGESLLNDGTAIVFFTLFYAWVIADSSAQDVNINALKISGQFLYVVSLGLIIGVTTALFCILWLDRVFNDPMIEITLTIACAYAVFFIAESSHVSGVVAVVTFALIMASIGRTRISPEVSGFLHHFWEMMAHIANTLIFLLVGILVAIRVPLNDPQAWTALAILYLGILLIRGFSIMVFMPLLKPIGIGINREKALVLWWGGLRGAVSLALALTLAADDLIPKSLGDLILFLCAGIVVLTILINGSTMGYLLKLLGLDSLPPAKQATVDKAQSKISIELNKLLPSMMDNQFLKGANWMQVKKQSQLQGVNESHQDADITEKDLTIAFQRRLLETERQDYWSQFEQGTLGKHATKRLVEAVEHTLDGDPSIGPRPELFNHWKIPTLLESLRGYPKFNQVLLRLYFNRLALGYDIARGFIQAQEALTSHIDALAPSPDAAAQVQQRVEENKRLTEKRIESLRDSFPEIIQQLQSQAAIRLLLNRERSIINELLKQAVLDNPEAQRLLTDVETRMQALQNISLFDNEQKQKTINQIPWAQNLSQGTQEKLAAIVEHDLYEPGQMIKQQDQTLNKIGIISRGSIKSSKSYKNNSQHYTKGPGETFASLSLLNGLSPASYQAESLVEIMWLSNDKLKLLMSKDTDLALIVANLLGK